MKTARTFILTALLSVLFAMPAMAKKKPADGCPTSAHALHSSNGKNLYHRKNPYTKYIHTGKSINQKKIHKFNKPRHTLNMKFKSPKHKSSTKLSSGGFYSFRNHGYTAHLFKSRKRF